jgi:hypothetical protein
MTRKILRRCSLCGKFHAAYLVPEHPGGKGYYCCMCWRATYPICSASALDQGMEGPSEPDATEPATVAPQQHGGT